MSLTGGWRASTVTPLVVPGEQTDVLIRQHHLLHGIASRMASAIPFPEVLAQVVEFATSVVHCDSCFVYVLEGDELVLRASKTPHPEVVDRLRLKMGEGITGWVAQHREPVAVSHNAAQDARFQFFNELPEDRFEAFLSVPLLSRGRVVGVINVQNRAPHNYSEREITLISTVGFLVGAEIEMARLERERSQLADRLEMRKLVERAKGILQRDLNVGEQESYLILQRQSQHLRKSMKEIAEAVVLTHSVKQGRSLSNVDSTHKLFEFDFISAHKQNPHTS